MFRSGTRRIAFIVGVFTVGVGTAAAAWLIYSGITGSGSGKVGTPTTIGALTFVPIPNTSAVIPGTPGSFDATIHNDSPSAQTITSIAGTFTTNSDPSCASHFTLDSSRFVGTIFQPTPANGFDWHVANAIVADAGLPAVCAGADITVTVTGTTS